MREFVELGWMANAYLEAGFFLIESIEKREFDEGYHNNFVPIFLLHQGFELLFKSGLKYRCGFYPKSHDLKTLRAEFLKEFPGCDFEIPDMILVVENKNDELFPEIALPKIIQHEKLRYPADKKGQAWAHDEYIEIMENIDLFKLLRREITIKWQPVFREMLKA